MKTTEVFGAMKPAVVAFVPRYGPPGSENSFPPILGTGVVVGEGLILTNAHVIRGLQRWRWNNPQDSSFQFSPMLLQEIPKRLNEKALGGGVAKIPLQVIGIFHLNDVVLKPEGYYYGPRRPDIALVHVKVRGLPTLQFLEDATKVEVGTGVLSLGFPMGTDALKAPGWMHQLSPMLQRGAISAVLPFPTPNPHGYIVDIPSCGGASGSPVCLADEPKAIGLLYGGLVDREIVEVEFSDGSVAMAQIPMPTAFSYLVPGHIIATIVKKITTDDRFKLSPDTKTLDEILDSAEFFTNKKPGLHEEQIHPEQVVEPGPDWIELEPITAPEKLKDENEF